MRPHNSARPPNHHWHAADQALIKETFSPCDFYWCTVEKKTNWATFLLDCRKIEYTAPFTLSLLVVSPTISTSNSALRLLHNFLFWQLSLIFPSLCSYVSCISTFLPLFILSATLPEVFFPLLFCYQFSLLSPIQPLPPCNSSFLCVWPAFQASCLS